jgi:hypothetical protein
MLLLAPGEQGSECSLDSPTLRLSLILPPHHALGISTLSTMGCVVCMHQLTIKLASHFQVIDSPCTALGDGEAEADISQVAIRTPISVGIDPCGHLVDLGTALHRPASSSSIYFSADGVSQRSDSSYSSLPNLSIDGTPSTAVSQGHTRHQHQGHHQSRAEHADAHAFQDLHVARQAPDDRPAVMASSASAAAVAAHETGKPDVAAHLTVHAEAKPSSSGQGNGEDSPAARAAVVQRVACRWQKQSNNCLTCQVRSMQS